MFLSKIVHLNLGDGSALIGATSGITAMACVVSYATGVKNSKTDSL
jgi:hypothetical protein